MNDISLFLAFAAGLLSFLSPCVLPLIPAYISYMAGITVGEIHSTRTRISVLYKSAGFILGFSIVFIIMGASVTTLGRLFQANQLLFKKISGTLILLFGLHTTGLLKIPALYREKRFLSFNRPSGTLSSIVIGMAFAAGWTPCIGPILGSILLYAGSTATVSRGILLLSVYSFGLALPFMLTAAAIGTFSKWMRKFTKYLPVISIISGILMIIMGILIFTNTFNKLSGYFNFITF